MMPNSEGSSKITGEALGNSNLAWRVLLIDHHPDYGRQLQKLLNDRPGVPLELRQASNLASALSILAKPDAADVVILNLDLPDSRGIDSALTVLRGTQDIPLLILAEPGQQNAAWQAVQHGARDVILRNEMTPEFLVWALQHTVEQHLLKMSLERQLRELELINGRFLSLVVDNADALLVIDRLGIVRFVNPSAEQLLRCSASELLGQMFGIPLEGIDRTEIDLRDRGARGRTVEIRVMRTLWDGERAFIVTMRDVTERKKEELALRLAKQAAEQANAMKSQFLANMSHELRTPLNAIIGYSEMMLMGVAGTINPERYRGYIEDIHVGGKHLLSLINDLLDLSKAESGHLDAAEESFDLAMLSASVVDLMQGQAVTGGLNLSVVTETPSIWVKADERMIKQILLNLMSNAIKFTPRGGSVTLTVRRDYHGATQIIIKDTGIGMPREQIPRAFAAFAQIENAYRKIKNRGTGLGLTLTKRFVELHQGKIALESEENVGTIVTITLPPSRSIISKAPDSAIVSIEAPVARGIKRKPGT